MLQGSFQIQKRRAATPLFEIDIPASVENLQLPDPDLLTFYKNKKERMFWIDYEIGTDILEVSKHIIEINRADKGVPAEDRKPINLCLFTPGGDLEATLSLANVILLSKTPVHTFNMGVAMSGGLILLLAGHKRHCLDGSRAMIHSGTNGLIGTAGQIEDASKDYKKMLDYMNDFIVSRSTIDKKLLTRNKARDWYLDAEEQIERGICHGKITDIDILL